MIWPMKMAVKQLVIDKILTDLSFQKWEKKKEKEDFTKKKNSSFMGFFPVRDSSLY